MVLGYFAGQKSIWVKLKENVRLHDSGNRREFSDLKSCLKSGALGKAASTIFAQCCGMQLQWTRACLGRKLLQRLKYKGDK